MFKGSQTEIVREDSWAPLRATIALIASAEDENRALMFMASPTGVAFSLAARKRVAISAHLISEEPD